MGSTRFSLGVANQMLRKKEYPCSYATYGNFYHTDNNQPELMQRRAMKHAIQDHYNEVYNKPSEHRLEWVRKSVSELVGTKRPRDKWTHTAVEKMYSFYAGKVICLVDLADGSFHGQQKTLWRFLRRCPTTVTSISALCVVLT
jgi:hypothetical protein